jgi:DNA repair exonuclease SbcCD ATPase subunit
MSQSRSNKGGGWRLSSVTLTDFRGVSGTQTYKFDSRPGLIWGPNGVGKSTLSLGIEWTLFGRFPSGVLGAPKDAFMSPVGTTSKAYIGVVNLACDDKILTVTRRDAGKELEVTVGAKHHKGDEAQSTIEAELGLDADTFVRSVLLQQSRIRGLLLDEPKERAKALDRLLGLDAAEAFLTLLKPREFIKAAEAWRKHIQEREAKYISQEELLKERLKQAETGLREHKFMDKHRSIDGLRGLYEQLERDLRAIAKKHEVDVKELSSADSPAAARKTSRETESAADRIRTDSKLQKQLAPLNIRIGALEAMLESWREAVASRDKAQKVVAVLLEKGRDEKSLAKRQTELENRRKDESKRLQRLSTLRSLLMQASDFFTANDVKTCPVCEQEISRPGDVVKSLTSRAESLSTKAVRDAEDAIAEIDAELKKVGEAREAAEESAVEFTAATKTIEVQRKRAAAALAQQMLIEKKVDAELAHAVASLRAERTKLEGGAKAIEADLEPLLDRNRNIRDVLLPFIEAREELRRLEDRRKQAKASHAKLDSKAEAMDDLATNVESIRKAVLAAKEEIAGGALKRASNRTQQLYAEMVQHALFDRLAIKADLKAAKVDYAFEVSSSEHSKSAREARLVLSDGQLTAAALGLFYALAESTAHGLDLLYVDDPTQNLDHSHKEAMAKVIADISTRKQVIVATQDEDFVSLLRDAGFEAAGITHHIESWDGRPSVTTTMGGA